MVVAGEPFRILSLDGGGSLGVYTLGILSELEAALDSPLHEEFNLVYGTSTGSIIASMLALEFDVQTIKEKYFEIVPDVMGKLRARSKTSRLEYHGKELYGEKTFEDVSLDIGIVTTDLEHSRPMVFKSNVGQAHNMAPTFTAGFGCKIVDAVIASSAAYPFFKKKYVETTSGPKTLADGGFAANNPTLLAITDAIGPMGMGVAKEDLRVVSLGTGSFPVKAGRLQRTEMVNTFMTLLGTNAKTIDTLRTLLFPDIQSIRIDDAFAAERYRTNFIESDMTLLESIFQLGRKSFGENQQELLGIVS